MRSVEICAVMRPAFLLSPHSIDGSGSVTWHGIPRHANGDVAVGNALR
jgi:hypothetical protein